MDAVPHPARLRRPVFQSFGTTGQIAIIPAVEGGAWNPRKASLADLEELLRPDIIKAQGNALAAAQLGDRVVAMQAVVDNPDLLLGREMASRCAPKGRLDSQTLLRTDKEQ